jgi:hypothetical protein
MNCFRNFPPKRCRINNPKNNKAEIVTSRKVLGQVDVRFSGFQFFRETDQQVEACVEDGVVGAGRQNVADDYVDKAEFAYN